MPFSRLGKKTQGREEGERQENDAPPVSDENPVTSSESHVIRTETVGNSDGSHR